jgi:hypothetical protein
MMTPRTLRRATLNGAGLALLATLACGTPAAAQTMNAAETLAYINERCGGSLTDLGGTTRMGRVVQSGPQISLHFTRNLSRRASGNDHRGTASFDLRRVDFGTYETAHTDSVRFTCGVEGCVTWRTQPLGSNSGSAHSTEQGSGARLPCRSAERVVNAFKHLQQLVGGRIADPVDPFAN